MPQIPIYQPRVGLPGEAPMAQPNMRIREGNPLEGLGQIAQLGGEAFQIVQRQHDENSRVWAGNAASTAYVGAQQQFDDLKANAGPGAPDFVPKVKEQFDTYKDQMLKAAPDDKSKLYLSQHFDALWQHIGTQAVHFQAEAGVQNRVALYGGAVDNATKVVSQDPAQFDNMLNVLEQTRPTMGDAIRDKALHDHTVETLTTAAAAHTLATNPQALYDLTGKALNIAPPSAPAPKPEGTLATIDGVPITSTTQGWESEEAQMRAAMNPTATPVVDQGPAAPGAETPNVPDGQPLKTGVSFIDKASLHQILTWRQQAHTEIQRGMAVDRAGIEQRVKDFQSVVLAGKAPPPEMVPSLDEFTRAFGPLAAQKYDSEVKVYDTIGKAIRQLGTASFSERQQVIQGLEPQVGAGFDNAQRIQGAVIQANKLVEQQIAADPAAYALSNAPGVKTAATQFAAVMGNPNATPQDRSAAVNAYAQATIAEQERLGVSQFRADVRGADTAKYQPGPRLLTNEQANSIAQQFTTAPANAAQLMDGLQSQWGSYFPQVFQQLTRDNKLPPSAMVIPNMSDAFAKETLARFSEPGALKGLKEQMPPGSETEITTKLQQLNEPFYTSTAYQQGGPSTAAIVAEQQKTLAMAYVAQGKSVGDATKLAYQQTVGHAYSFQGTLRVPLKEQPDQIMGGTRVILNNLQTLDTTAPPSFRPGLTDTDRANAWRDAIRGGATWVANGDESGTNLYVRAKNEAGVDSLFAVRSSDGKPLSWSWSQLRNLYAQRPAEAASVDALQKALAKGDRATAEQIQRDQAASRLAQRNAPVN